MYTIKRDETSIDDLLQECSDNESKGTSKFSGMTYEQGIIAAIDWLVGTVDANPMED